MKTVIDFITDEADESTSDVNLFLYTLIRHLSNTKMSNIMDLVDSHSSTPKLKPRPREKLFCSHIYII